tara:strand:- start:136 stop:378 length:243 start_codon:yes stop_codon:yes gene_type:complete
MSNTKKAVTPTPAVKINAGGLNVNLIYTATGKVARASHNAERHKALSGKTVGAALASRLVNAADIKYDLAKGFITLNPAS